MKPARILAATLFALLFALGGIARAQLAPVPPLGNHLNDLAGMLDAQQRQRLDAVLAEYETKTGNQIAILLVNSTAPEAIEQYSIRVADAWKLGRKGVDDGVLLVVAKDNPSSLRRLRIESGRGVQGVLTDAQSKRILQDVIAPHFRTNDYYGGLIAGAGAIAALLGQEAFPAPPPQERREASSGAGWLPMVLVAVFVLAQMFRPRRSRLRSGGWGHGATGFVLGSVLGSMSQGRGGGFGGGGFGGGGGFSGGGGTFDGGGASGDW